ncbi:phage baseplate assembly protein V [Melaminivora sp.]|uniref:phage baseplate assembly protein V n=1 Tax=Melaminivora sp. TaxID=1933032 RepID=UPI0028B11F12|nr:phage baseplate assembly protein V [Melaminivora sp.]
MFRSIPQHDTPQEATRRLENIARLGTVAAVRHAAPARCRVKLGGNTTGWLPWLAGRAGGQQGCTWWPPAVGEQCLVISPGGDLGQGLVLLGVYSDAMDAPADEPGVDRIQWSANNWAEYREGRRTIHLDRAIRLEVGDGCSIAMEPDSITLSAGGATVHIGGGKVTSNVDVIADGISLMLHKHGKVRSGADLSGAPQ